MSSTKYGLDVYKNYDGSVLSLEGDDGEGYSWRNIYGEPIIAVSTLFPSDFDDIIAANDDTFSVLSTLCHQRPYAGAYELTIDDDSYDAYRAAYDGYYSALIDTPSVLLDDSVLWRTYQQQAVYSAQTDAPITVSLTSYSRYNLLGRVIDRMAVAIDILDGAVNDQIVPGFGISFNSNLYGSNKAHLIVGGSYLANEDRYYEGTIFGTVPIGASSEETAITIKNISGSTLVGLTAKILNRYAVYQDMSSRPLCYIDQSGIYAATAVSPFASATMQFQDTDSCLTKVKIDGEFYDIRTDPSSILIDDEDMVNSALVSCNAQTKYMFADGTPLAGLTFALNPNLTDDESATVYTYNGEGVYEISSDGNTWETEEITLASSLAADATDMVYVRAKPVSALLSLDTYGTDAYLRIMAAYETAEGPTSIVTKTLDDMSGWSLPDYVMGHKGIRLVIPALSYRADAVRVKFVAPPTGDILQRLKIDEVHYGARDGDDTSNMKTSPEIKQMTFSGVSTLELEDLDGLGSVSQWTDWLEFPMDAEAEHVISYHGPLVGAPTEDAGVAYYSDQVEDSGDAEGDGYTEVATWYDVEEVQIKIYNHVVSLIPLTTTVPEYIQGKTINAYILNDDLSSVLTEMGITSEVVA